MFVNEFNILIGEVQSLKKLYETLKLYLNLNSCADIFQRYLIARRTNLTYLKKLPSGFLKFVLLSIRTHQNLKKGSVNSFSVIYFKL